jgi:hypothetical protein
MLGDDTQTAKRTNLFEPTERTRFLSLRTLNYNIYKEIDIV